MKLGFEILKARALVGVQGLGMVVPGRYGVRRE